jgi:hypothetical protein
MQRLLNKLNLTASVAMVYMVIKKIKKKNLLVNVIRVGRTVSKHDTTRAIADDLRLRHFARI